MNTAIHSEGTEEVGELRGGGTVRKEALVDEADEICWDEREEGHVVVDFIGRYTYLCVERKRERRSFTSGSSGRGVSACIRQTVVVVMGAHGSREQSLDSEATFMNTGRGGFDASGGSSGAGNVDMEMGAMSPAGTNVGGRLAGAGDDGMSLQGEYPPDGAIMSNEVLPRHLVGLEWEILGLLDQTRPFSQAVIHQIESSNIEREEHGGSGSSSYRRGDGTSRSISIRNDVRVRKDSVRLRPVECGASSSSASASDAQTRGSTENDSTGLTPSCKYSLDFVFDASARCSVSVVFVRGCHLPVSLQNVPLLDLGLPLVPLTSYDRGSGHVFTLHGDELYVDRNKLHGTTSGIAASVDADDANIVIDFGKIEEAIAAAVTSGDTRECIVRWDGNTILGNTLSAHETGDVFKLDAAAPATANDNETEPFRSHVDVIIHIDAHNEHHINQQTKRDKRGRRRSHSQTTYARFYRSEEIREGSTKSAADGNQWHASVLSQVVDAFSDLYELLEIYGSEPVGGTGGGGDAAGASGAGTGSGANGEQICEGVEDCVVCLSAPRDTASLPCRHLCLCNSCAQELRQHSQTCPVCRAPVHTFLRIRTPSAISRNITTETSS